MKRAAMLLFQNAAGFRALYLGRNVMTPDEVKELWGKYQEAEAELHWIMPPVDPFTALIPNSRDLQQQRGISMSDVLTSEAVTDTHEMVVIHRAFRRESRLLGELVGAVPDGDSERAAILGSASGLVRGRTDEPPPWRGRAALATALSSAPASTRRSWPAWNDSMLRSPYPCRGAEALPAWQVSASRR